MSINATIIGNQVQLSGNPVYIEVTNPTPPTPALFYKYLLRVISQDGTLIGAPFEDAIAPDTSNVSLFDISGYVDQAIAKIFQYEPTDPFIAYPTVSES